MLVINQGQNEDIEAKNEQDQAEREATAQNIQEMQDLIIMLKKENKTLKEEYKEKREQDKVTNEL